MMDHVAFSARQHLLDSPLFSSSSVSPTTIPGKLDIPLNSQEKAEAQRKLVEAGRQFESYFISYLLKVMRETVPQGALSSKDGAYFHSFYDEEIGRRAAESGGIGIARMVEEYAKTYLSVPPVERSSSAL